MKALTKLYYSIGEVADFFSVNPSLIRFWEKEFNLIQPKKSKKGNRMFTPKDIETFNKIYHLVKVKGYTLEGARKILHDKKQFKELVVEPAPINIPSLSEVPSLDPTEVIKKLEGIKERLLALKSNRQLNLF
ncbi:MAG: MerR family transcriptional regulator [Crocinitomicaceae bacterium]|nr:MerR family transcriptional regulator [Crocinitomicaceae bacterium]